MDSPSDVTDGAAGRTRLHGRRAHGHHLTPRDLDILRWMARHGVVLSDFVGRRFFWRSERKTYGRWATYNRLAALQHLGLVRQTRSPAYPDPVWRVTETGARIADVGLQPAPLVHTELRHTLALVRLTEFLRIQHAPAELVTERELRAERWRQLRAGTRDVGRGRTPDGVLVVPTGRDGTPGRQTIAIELDVSRKDRATAARMIRQYDDEPFDRVLWFVRPARVELARALVREMNADDRFQVDGIELEQLLPRLGAFETEHEVEGKWLE